MQDIVFYEKPGCINNTKQKKLLKNAGYRLKERNLLTEPWTAARLLAFFNNLPVSAWFNQSAPAVKSGDIQPDMLTAEQAIHCMLSDPLLIRRPLMEIGDQKVVGFETQRVQALLDTDISQNENLEDCPRVHASTASDTDE
ncbi:MAG: ArsC/Spx/MgsR family protein [Gammaproteobacteria bacterium]|jgi:nitrogenase-associated protein